MWGSASGHKIESETEPDIDFGSFLTQWRHRGVRGSKQLKDCRRMKELTGQTQSILDAPFIDFRVWRKTGARLWGR